MILQNKAKRKQKEIKKRVTVKSLIFYAQTLSFAKGHSSINTTMSYYININKEFERENVAIKNGLHKS